MSRKLDALKAITGGTGNTYTQVLESSQTLINDDSSGGGSLDSLFKVISLDCDVTNRTYSPHDYDTVADLYNALLTYAESYNHDKIIVIYLYNGHDVALTVLADNIYVYGHDEIEKAIAINVGSQVFIDNNQNIQIMTQAFEITPTEIIDDTKQAQITVNNGANQN